MHQVPIVLLECFSNDAGILWALTWLSVVQKKILTEIMPFGLNSNSSKKLQPMCLVFSCLKQLLRLLLPTSTIFLKDCFSVIICFHQRVARKDSIVLASVCVNSLDGRCFGGIVTIKVDVWKGLNR